VSAIEAHERVLADRGARDRRDALELVRGRAVGDGDAEVHAAFGHARVIPDRALEELSVGEDELVTVERPHAGGAQSHRLDGAHEALRLDEIADHERLADQDRHRRQHVPDHVLQRQRDDEAADPQSGEQCRHIDAEIVEQEEDEQPAERDARQHGQRR
jgi:hypothetical protein